MPSDTIRERWLFQGAYLGSDDKIAYHWVVLGKTDIEIELQGPVEDAVQRRTFGARLAKKCRPGCVFDFNIERTEKELWVCGAGKEYVGFWGHTEEQTAQTTQWQVLHDAALAARTAINKQNRERSQNTIYAALLPIHKAYRRAAPSVRRQIIAIVLDKIVQG